MDIRDVSSTIVTAESATSVPQQTKRYPELIAGCTSNYYRPTTKQLIAQPSKVIESPVASKESRPLSNHIQKLVVEPTVVPSQSLAETTLKCVVAGGLYFGLGAAVSAAHALLAIPGCCITAGASLSGEIIGGTLFGMFAGACAGPAVHTALVEHD